MTDLECVDRNKSECVGTVKLTDGKPRCTRHALQRIDIKPTPPKAANSRTPIILASLTAFLAVVVAVTVGYIATHRTSPATTDTAVSKTVPTRTRTVTVRRTAPVAPQTPAKQTTAKRTRSNSLVVEYIVETPFPVQVAPVISSTGESDRSRQVSPNRRNSSGNLEWYYKQTFKTAPNYVGVTAWPNEWGVFVSCEIRINGVSKVIQVANPEIEGSYAECRLSPNK